MLQQVSRDSLPFKSIQIKDFIFRFSEDLSLCALDKWVQAGDDDFGEYKK